MKESFLLRNRNRSSCRTDAIVRAAVLLAGVIVTLFAPTAAAVAVNPDTVFTLRAGTNTGPATSLSSTTANNGFTGSLSNFEPIIVDRTFVEFDLFAFGGPLLNATLDFDLSGGDPADVISLGWYDGNGVAELADWTSSQTSLATFNATVGAHSIDVASVINANLGTLAYLGFGFSIDPWPNQAFFAVNTIAINYDPQAQQPAVPIPPTAWLFASGIIGLVLVGIKPYRSTSA